MAVAQTQLHFTNRAEFPVQLRGTWQKTLEEPSPYAGLT